MSKRCFVIAPIGLPDSEIREHSDAVFRFIIEPAMRECGIEAFRSDHLKEPGRITEQMFREILEDDLCIGVMTGHNPNVFYEVAVAQSAGRPVILLCEQGEVMPFDFHDQRFVEYSMKPAPLVDGVYAREVVAHIRSLESSGWLVSSPFAPLLAGNKPGAGSVGFKSKSFDFGTSKDWRKLLEDASSTFEMMGIGLSSWRKTSGFNELVAAKAASGCRVRILVMHPENPALPHLFNESVQDDEIEDVKADIARVYAFFQKVAAPYETVNVRQIRTGLPHYQLVRNDSLCVWIPYLYSERTSLSPLFHSDERHPAHAILGREFASLWDANSG